jgi:hypothetical protein
MRQSASDLLDRLDRHSSKYDPELWEWAGATSSIWKSDCAIQREFPEQLDFLAAALEFAETLIRSASLPETERGPNGSSS